MGDFQQRYDFTENVIMADAPALVGVYGLFRPNLNTRSEEPLCIEESTNLRSDLVILRRSGSFPTASYFKFQVSDYQQAIKRAEQLRRKMPKTYGKKWRPTTGKPIGSGGQSHVKLVEDVSGKNAGLYALKALRNVESPQARARFKSEIQATQRINHPNSSSTRQVPSWFARNSTQP